MAYSNQYTAEDISEAVIDGSTRVTLQFVAFAAIFALLIVIGMIGAVWRMIKKQRR